MPIHSNNRNSPSTKSNLQAPPFFHPSVDFHLSSGHFGNPGKVRAPPSAKGLVVGCSGQVWWSQLKELFFRYHVCMQPFWQVGKGDRCFHTSLVMVRDLSLVVTDAIWKSVSF